MSRVPPTTRFLWRLCAMLCFVTSAAVQSDTVVIPIASQAEREAAGPLPQLGMSRSQVRSRWGAPQREHAAVGDPPIQRWEYPVFDVYFEYDHVLHAVVRHKPPAPIILEPPAAEE